MSAVNGQSFDELFTCLEFMNARWVNHILLCNYSWLRIRLFEIWYRWSKADRELNNLEVKTRDSEMKKEKLLVKGKIESGIDTMQNAQSNERLREDESTSKWKRLWMRDGGVNNWSWNLEYSWLYWSYKPRVCKNWMYEWIIVWLKSVSNPRGRNGRIGILKIWDWVKLWTKRSIELGAYVKPLAEASDKEWEEEMITSKWSKFKYRRGSPISKVPEWSE